MDKKAILCIDDEAIIVMSIEQELKAHFKDRFLYATALSAADGLSIIDELSADGERVVLLISDWLMPEMKGDEFITKAKEQHPDMKTILVTGHAPDDTIGKISNADLINALIQKPWNSRDLITTVERCIGTFQDHA